MPRTRTGFAPSLLGLLLVPALAAAPGCGEARKQAECTRVIETINGAASQLEGPVTDEKAMLERAERLAALGKAIAELGVSDPELVADVEAYREMLQAMGGLMTEMVAATKAGDVTKIQELGKRADDAGRRESELVGRINARCNRR